MSIDDFDPYPATTTYVEVGAYVHHPIGHMRPLVIRSTRTPLSSCVYTFCSVWPFDTHISEAVGRSYLLLRPREDRAALVVLVSFGKENHVR
eukprot:2643109-Prorocentrum_lima.AAC.1